MPKQRSKRGKLLRLSGDPGGRAIVDRHFDDLLKIAIGSEDICLDIDSLESYNLAISEFR